ncbi:MAG: hypothetical protein CV089_14385 [Nitrospira sp. WS110]|nr:hypothetical protein [Nitrospira sp. WS110]
MEGASLGQKGDTELDERAFATEEFLNTDVEMKEFSRALGSVRLPAGSASGLVGNYISRNRVR